MMWLMVFKCLLLFVIILFRVLIVEVGIKLFLVFVWEIIFVKVLNIN